MSSTAAMRGAWAPPGRDTPQLTKVVMESSAEGAIVVVDARTADAFRALDAVLKAHAYPTRRADTGGYFKRKIRGGDGWSLHSYGICVDVNWQTNPYIRRTTPWGGGFGPTVGIPAGTVTDFTPAIVQEILSIRTNSGKQVFRWGGQYGTVMDAMHWEILLPPSDLATGVAGVTSLAGAPSWTPPPVQPVGRPTLEKGSRGSDVRALQEALAAAGFGVGQIDGDFGPKTDAAVRAFQGSRQLGVDGIVGTQTWAALLLGVPAVADPQQRPFRGTDGDGADAPPVDPASLPQLAKGAKGDAVRRLQAELNADGAALDEDGVFGPATLRAVTAWQRANGLGADGIVGPKTWRALLAA